MVVQVLMLLVMMLIPEPENFTMVDNMEDAVKGQDIVFIAVSHSMIPV